MIPVHIITPNFEKTVHLTPNAMTAVLNILHSGTDRREGYSLHYRVGISDFQINNAPPKAVDYIINIYKAGGFT